MVYEKLPKVITKIFIDLDDTLVDFYGELMTLLGYKGVYTSQESKALWHHLLKEDEQVKVWAKIKEAGPSWWASLPKLPWADDLLEAAHKACDDVAILTSPGHRDGAQQAAHGKLLWSFKHFGDNSLVMAHKKYMCSSPGAVLIDDWDKFADPWEERGGTALLLKRGWHDRGHHYNDIIDALRKYGRFR